MLGYGVELELESDVLEVVVGRLTGCGFAQETLNCCPFTTSLPFHRQSTALNGMVLDLNSMILNR